MRLLVPILSAVLAASAGARADEALTLADAPDAERQAIARLLESPTWARRAVAIMRLERYGCAASEARLVERLDDVAWPARAFAVRTLARRGVEAGPAWFADEHEPRMVRTALRCRYAIDPGRIERGVRYLARSRDLDERLLAAEIGAASGNPELVELATDLARTVILRMSRAEGGRLSPRLARLTGEPDRRRTHRWQRWVMSDGRRFTARAAHEVPAAGEGDPPPPCRIAALPPEDFVGLVRYMDELSRRRIDLAICLDCTASMSGELAAAQAGLDDLMLFVDDVAAELRVAIVAYRDRRDEFETKAWDFTTSIGAARDRLWSLSADGGGDGPEAVHDALRLAYTRLGWNRDHEMTLVLVGDAPPHVGLGTQCVDLARRGAAHDLTTHVIQAEGRPVKHFPEIAAAGAGQCVALEDDGALIAEIAGLTIGRHYTLEFVDFFESYLALCR